MIARINSFAGRELVRRIKIVQGPLGPSRPRSVPSRPLSEPETAEIEAQAGQVADSGLKSALSALGAAIKSRLVP